ncbi:hypothetical protein E1264_09515 [Actinomadura sp. KC216]|uniref:NrfD/PsrC family molybdoenzyme membrane anchor subunit n=1 Tax=Actinomadura sp. KC216 TaxID=2530370 RepID=UPI001048A2D1|nr:NrfD/PsrC family molybdoenzyme membrane anchor subunit [Actinomadura sp. KC216]TDB89013.1 hypothetical protein E1264_09515 [Actinomadura sp. KC216]
MAFSAANGHPLPEPPWGVLLAVYFVMVGIPSGITLYAWWINVQGAAVAAPVERYGSWAALGILAAASLLLVMDLGRPSRFYLTLTRFDNLGSPISVGAKLITIKMVLLAIAVYAVEQRRRRPEPSEGQVPSRFGTWCMKAVPYLLLATSFALAIYPVSVLSRSWASPLAHTSGAALIFLLTALLMGAAVVMLLSSLFPPAPGTRADRRFWRRDPLVLLGFYCAALLFEGLSLHGDPPNRRLLAELLTGGLAPAFWGLVVFVGIAVPAAGTALRSRRAACFVAGTALLVGTAAARYLVFAAGR